VAILGSVLSGYVSDRVHAQGAPGYDGHKVPNLAAFEPALRALVQDAYAHGAAAIYLACVPFALTILVCVLLLRARTLEDDHAPAKST
jgi:hypothetical protein